MEKLDRVNMFREEKSYLHLKLGGSPLVDRSLCNLLSCHPYSLTDPKK